MKVSFPIPVHPTVGGSIPIPTRWGKECCPAPWKRSRQPVDDCGEQVAERHRIMVPDVSLWSCNCSGGVEPKTRNFRSLDYRTPLRDMRD